MGPSNAAHDHTLGDGGDSYQGAGDPARHDFSPHERRQARRLAIVIALVSAFFGVELTGALIADSVVLQADALHLLVDVLALGVSLFAMRLAIRRPTSRFTFGLRRAEPVAAIFSAGLVLATTALIVVEGVRALGGHAAPKAGVMLLMAVLAVVVHGLSAWLLQDAIGHPHGPGHSHGHGDGEPHGHGHAPDRLGHEGPKHGPGHSHGHSAEPEPSHARGRKAHGHALNLRGAWLHLAGDAMGAVAALVAALVIRFGGDPAADPIASFAVAAILVVGALGLLRDAILVLLEAAPVHLPIAAVRRIVSGFPDVAQVHELHVWTLGAGHDAVTAHVVTRSADPSLGQRLSQRLRTVLGAEYVTVQVDFAGPPAASDREAT